MKGGNFIEHSEAATLVHYSKGRKPRDVCLTRYNHHLEVKNCYQRK